MASNALNEELPILNKMIEVNTTTHNNLRIIFPSYDGWGLLIGRNSSSKAILIVVSPAYANSLTPNYVNSNIATSKNPEGDAEITLNKIGNYLKGIFIGDFKSISYF